MHFIVVNTLFANGDMLEMYTNSFKHLNKKSQVTFNR